MVLSWLLNGVRLNVTPEMVVKHRDRKRERVMTQYRVNRGYESLHIHIASNHRLLVITNDSAENEPLHDRMK